MAVKEMLPAASQGFIAVEKLEKSCVCFTSQDCSQLEQPHLTPSSCADGISGRFRHQWPMHLGESDISGLPSVLLSAITADATSVSPKHLLGAGMLVGSQLMAARGLSVIWFSSVSCQ